MQLKTRSPVLTEQENALLETPTGLAERSQLGKVKAGSFHLNRE